MKYVLSFVHDHMSGLAGFSHGCVADLDPCCEFIPCDVGEDNCLEIVEGPLSHGSFVKPPSRPAGGTNLTCMTLPAVGFITTAPCAARTSTREVCCLHRISGCFGSSRHMRAVVSAPRTSSVYRNVCYVAKCVSVAMSPCLCSSPLPHLHAPKAPLRFLCE